MKPPPFRYARPATLEEAIALLARLGAEAQILAGGQSLMPTLNFRLSAPEVLIDINAIAGLDGIAEHQGSIRIGALVRHAALMESALVARHLPLIAAAMPHVAHPAVRNRGTFGGSLALGDPAAELPACAVALGATLVLAGPAGERVVPAERFYRGLYDTDRRPDEILVAALVPRAAPHERTAFLEFSRRHGDFAVAGVALRAAVADDVITELRLVVFGCTAFPRLAPGAAMAVGQRLTAALAERVAAAVAAEIEPMADLQGSQAFKRRLVAVLVRRALAPEEAGAA